MPADLSPIHIFVLCVAGFFGVFGLWMLWRIVHFLKEISIALRQKN